MAIEKHYTDNTISTTFAQAPARTISKSVTIEQVVIVITGNKADERILPQALNFARKHNAELLIVNTCEASMSNQAELYLKSLLNKAQKQYTDVIAFLHQGTDVVAALESVIDDNKVSCVMLPTDNRNWLQRLWSGNVAGDLESHHPALMIREVQL